MRRAKALCYYAGAKVYGGGAVSSQVVAILTEYAHLSKKKYVPQAFSVIDNMSDTYLKVILVSAVECKLLKKLTIED